MKDNKGLFYFYLLYILFLFGYIFSWGFYFFVEAVLLLFFLLLLGEVFIFGKLKKAIKTDLTDVVILERLIISFSLIFYLCFLLPQQNKLFTLLIIILLISQLLLTVFLSSQKILFIYSLFVTFFLGVLVILSSPAPQIDVFVTLKEGAEAFLKGVNPYSIMYSKIPLPFYENIIPNYYPYLPGMIYLTLPAVLLFGDPRCSVLLLTLMTAIMLAIFFKDYYLPIIFLFNPLYPSLLSSSYTDPMLFFLVAGFIILSCKKRFNFSAAVFALFFATKQYAILFLPFYWFAVKKKLTTLTIFFSIVSLVCLPFLIWDVKGFVDDAILYQFKVAIRYDGLTFVSLLHNAFGVDVPLWILPFIWGISLLMLIFSKKISTYSDLLSRLFFFLFIFFFFNKMAFLNYYYLLSSIFLLAIAFLKRDVKIDT